MSRADDVVQAFYEDADLRDSLTDDEADVLLRWASEQAARLDASGADDAAFDDLASQLRQLVKRINRYAGEGLYTPPDAQAAALTAIAQGAQGIGLATAPAFSAQAAPADPMAALTGVLASFSPAESAPAELTVSAAETFAEAESAPEAPAPAEAAPESPLPPSSVSAGPPAAEAPGPDQPPDPFAFDEGFYDV